MRARPNMPSYGIRRAPHTNALTAAASRQIPSEPSVQLGVKNDDWIAEVGAMGRSEGWGRDLREGDASIGGIRRSRILASVVVVVVDDDGLSVVFGAGPGIAFALGTAGRRGAGAVTDEYVRGS